MEKNDERQSFVMYASFLEAAEQLDADAFKECVLKLRDYALYGENVYSKDPVVNIILTMAKPNISAAAARYQRCVENGNKGKEYGSRGGRPRKGETKIEYDARRGKTPRKPLDVEDDENKEKKEKRNEKLIQSPMAMEPTRGSGNSIGSFLPLPIESFYRPGSPDSPSNEYIDLIYRQGSNMSENELADRYESIIDKMAQARANGKRHKHEALLAAEAAMICQRLDKLPTLEGAMKSVVQDINAAIQMELESTQEDENDTPF